MKTHHKRFGALIETWIITNSASMQRVILFVCGCVFLANAQAPTQPIYNPNNNIPIVKYESENNGEAGYRYLYETGDGTTANEAGFLKDPDSPTAQGGFGFTAPDGQRFEISYTADENGFLPQGAHIPTPPPIPAEILKALEQNAADEARGIVDDGQYHPEQSPHQQYQQGAAR